MSHHALRAFDERSETSDGSILHPLIRRLETFRFLAAADRDVLLKATMNMRSVAAQTDLMREGDAPDVVRVLVEGFACRYKIVDNGKRQIVGFLVPGDICDAHVLTLGHTDHNVAVLTDSQLATIPRDAMEAILAAHPAIVRVLLWSSLVNESISREWLANMGRRSPNKRIGHLLCEMLTRLGAVGLADNDRFAFPITQADLGDTVGLSTVHVNRTLQELKAKKLIASKRWLFEVIDVPALMAFSDFDAAYLHLDPGPAAGRPGS